jgi:hypothetical protein
MDLKVLKGVGKVADYFVDNGFAFLKFNFSHNGMGLEDQSNSEHLIIANILWK